MLQKEKLVHGLERAQEYFIYLLIFFTPISIAGIEISFTLALFTFFIKKALRPDFRFSKNLVSTLLFTFAYLNLLSVLTAWIFLGVYFKKSFIAFFFKWSEYFFIFLLIGDTFNKYRKIKNALYVFLFGALLVSFDGIYQFLSGIDFLRHREVVIVAGKLYGLTASFQHYNDFGTYLAMLIAIAFSFLLLPGLKRLYMTLLSVLLLFSVICLYFTFSRGSWLNFCVIMFVFLVLGTRKKIIVFSSLAFVTILLMLPEFRERWMFSFDPIRGSADRFFVWKIASQIIRDFPWFGTGVGTFMDYFHIYYQHKTVQYAHNCFLQIWAETGIFSLMVFLGFLVALLSKGVVYFRREKTVIAQGLLAGLCGFLVHSFFDTQFYSVQMSVLFWSVAGLLSALVHNIATRRETLKE